MIPLIVQGKSRMEMLCERFPIGGNFSSDVELEHLERYRYSAAFVNGADVIDIASGSASGSRLLTEGDARSVRGFFVDSSAAEYATEHFAAGNLYFGYVLRRTGAGPEGYATLTTSAAAS